MDMPVDILNRELGKIRDNGDIDFDNTMAAVSIDEILQEDFVFFPVEELDEIAEQIEHYRGWLKIGQRPGYLCIDENISVEDAYTLAENAIAIWWEVKRRTEVKLEQEKLAKRPEPGVYTGNGGSFTVIVTAARRVLVPLTSGGTKDYTTDWDHYLHKSWVLRPINTADGSIGNPIERVGTPTPTINPWKD